MRQDDQEKVKTSPLDGFSPSHPASSVVPLPRDLPALVARFLRRLYGEDVPVIHSLVVTGRARLRIMGSSRLELPFGVEEGLKVELVRSC